jgi:uncharacterized protein YbaP (TraB family)
MKSEIVKLISKKNSLFILIAFAFLISSCKTTSKAVSTETDQLEKALLWELTGKDIKQPSYIYGTIHIIEAKDYFLPNGLLSAIDQSKKMVFEIDMKAMNDMSTMMGMMSKLFMKDDLTLKDLYKEEEYQEVQDFFKKKGLPLMFLERMKPMFLSALAYVDIGPGGLQGSETVKSYEFELAGIAENKNLETAGLETMEFQIGIFDAIPYDAQAQMLLQAIRAGDVENEEMKAMVDMYKKQDIEKMANMVTSDGSDLENYSDVLLGDRNRNWIPLIIQDATKQPTIFAVGAGHLGGKDGVIRLLKAQGYNLKPLSNTNSKK